MIIPTQWPELRVKISQRINLCSNNLESTELNIEISDRIPEFITVLKREEDANQNITSRPQDLRIQGQQGYESFIVTRVPQVLQAPWW